MMKKPFLDQVLFTMTACNPAVNDSSFSPSPTKPEGALNNTIICTFLIVFAGLKFLEDILLESKKKQEIVGWPYFCKQRSFVGWPYFWKKRSCLGHFQEEYYFFIDSWNDKEYECNVGCSRTSTAEKISNQNT